MRGRASEDSIVASKSLARRLARLIQPNVRSLGQHDEALDLLVIAFDDGDGRYGLLRRRRAAPRRRCSLESTKLIVTNGLLRRTSRKTGGQRVAVLRVGGA